jgi:hypothetical protein
MTCGRILCTIAPALVPSTKRPLKCRSCLHVHIYDRNWSTCPFKAKLYSVSSARRIVTRVRSASTPYVEKCSATRTMASIACARTVATSAICAGRRSEYPCGSTTNATGTKYAPDGRASHAPLLDREGCRTLLLLLDFSYMMFLLIYKPPVQPAFCNVVIYF